MKKISLLLLIIPFMAFSQVPIHDTTRLYDEVTDGDTCYLFSFPKPCFNPTVYEWAPQTVMVQEYVSADTITVYGVAIPLKNVYGNPICDNFAEYQALLMRRIGPSPDNHYAFSFELVDSVTLNRSHPRFCWFRYTDPCKENEDLVAPCYEFYFDTPAQMNRVADTFYVGRYYSTASTPGIGLREFGGEYSNSMPGTIYHSLHYQGMFINRFFHADGYQDKKWGAAFPIIGFRCGPIRQYWLDSYTGDSAVVRWRSVEQGTQYNVRLVGSDGTDTTFVTPDTTLTLTPLSDSVRYDVMLRKQCHYATTNYDTTVYGQWLSGITFGPVPSDTTSGGDDTVGIAQSQDEAFALAPNPASGTVQVLLPASAVGGHLTLCDLAGRELLAIEIRRTPVTFDVSKLPAGTYLVNLLTPQGRTSRTLLVE